MKETTKVISLDVKNERATIAVERRYFFTTEHFKVFTILLCDASPNIYKGINTEAKRKVRYKAICELGDMGILGTYLDDENPVHFITEYGIEIAKKICAVGYKK